MKKFLTLVAVAFAGLALAKTEIEVPTLAPAVYDGTVQAAQVPASPDWRTAFSGKGEHAGTYDVILKLTDPANTCWKGSAECWTAVPFVIAQAANRWTTAPAIAGWTYGETPSVPEAAAAFGAVRPVVYRGVTAAGAAVTGAAAVREAGDYTAVFDVAGTDDYTALHAEVSFTVARERIADGDLSVTLGGFPTFNGREQEAVISSVTCRGAPIPYSVTGNRATDAGEYSLVVTAVGNHEGEIEMPWRILPRDIARAEVAKIADQIATGKEVRPVPVVRDGTPSIITSEDYSLSYANNVRTGTATLTLTGLRNYTGTKSVTFAIRPNEATLVGQVNWKYLALTRTYFAQLLVKCTSGYSAGISNLRFGFADCDRGGKGAVRLWDSSAGAAVANTYASDGVTYRTIPLDAKGLRGENVASLYGVSAISASSIPVPERIIELSVPAKNLPSLIGYCKACIIWDSNGKTHVAPITGMVVR